MQDNDKIGSQNWYFIRPHNNVTILQTSVTFLS